VDKLPASMREDFLAASRAAKNPLQFLTANDWLLIIDKAIQVNFEKDDRLIREGRELKTLYLLIKGTVTVSIWGKPLAHIGPGEVCGEMAFLENSLASATVIADNEVETYAVEWTTLVDLFQLFPHLASRFYQSLAVNLSRRLRQQTASK
jgi:CRP-like cAMP-binding protein